LWGFVRSSKNVSGCRFNPPTPKEGQAETEMANMFQKTGERVEEEESIFLYSILLKMSSVIVSFWMFCKC
jgi:hypothetical protein